MHRLAHTQHHPTPTPPSSSQQLLFGDTLSESQIKMKLLTETSNWNSNLMVQPLTNKPIMANSERLTTLQSVDSMHMRPGGIGPGDHLHRRSSTRDR